MAGAAHTRWGGRAMAVFNCTCPMYEMPIRPTLPLLQGWPAARCGGLASLLGAETVKCLGAQPDADGWARIHARIGLS